MSAVFSKDGLSYTQGSGEFTLLAAQNWGNAASPTSATSADVRVAAYGSYYGFYKDNGSKAPFRTPSVTASPVSNSMNIYMGTQYFNYPYVNIYINGSSMPIPLELDTAATGIMINASALASAGISLPESDFDFAGGFGSGDTFSGYISYANVSTSGGIVSQDMPIAVATTDTAFPSSGLLQGDFGMGLSPSPNASFGYNNGGTTIFTPSFADALPVDDNGYVLNFNIAFNQYGYNNAIESTAPAGTIIYGLNTTSDNAIPAGSYFYPNSDVNGYPYDFPTIPSEFGGDSFNSAGSQFYSFFDTGSGLIYMGNGALNDSISSFSSSYDVDASCDNFINGGLQVSFSLKGSNDNYIPNNFITDPNSPDNNFCDYGTFSPVAEGNAIALDNALYYGGIPVSMGVGVEDFGLPFMFNQPMYWQAQSPQSSWGVGIEP
jgi:hypothetical protein